MSTAKPPHRRTVSLQKTKIIINCYDLLPQGNLTTTLWALGLSLLHSGVVVGNKEYAYGGHDRPNLTGVYWTQPSQAPPGSTHRAEIHHGFTILSDAEINQVIHDASKKFLGPDWNLLSNNCNHFTNYLCEELTGMPAPSWLNRAAAVGVRMPCLLPREFVRAPGAEEAALGTVEEEDESDDDYAGEGGHLLARSRSRESYLVTSDESSEEEEQREGGSDGEYTSEESEDDRTHGRNGRHLAPPVDQSVSRGRRKKKRRRNVRDTEGRVVPRSERAPVR